MQPDLQIFSLVFHCQMAASSTVDMATAVGDVRFKTFLPRKYCKKDDLMKAFVYGVRQEMPNKFAESVLLNESAVISIDMHTRHLSPDGLGPCLAPRGLEIIEPVDKLRCAACQCSVPVIPVRSMLRKTGEEYLGNAYNKDR